MAMASVFSLLGFGSTRAPESKKAANQIDLRPSVSYPAWI
jgi:hypothetical protein